MLVEGGRERRRGRGAYIAASTNESRSILVLLMSQWSFGRNDLREL